MKYLLRKCKIFAIANMGKFYFTICGIVYIFIKYREFILIYKGVIYMKEKIKPLLRFIATFVITFFVVYLFVFFVGWKLFESGDPILIIVGVAFVLSFFIFFFMEIILAFEKKIERLEARIDELEKK